VIEVIPILIGVMLAATVVASTGYYKRIQQAQKEYEKARSAVEDIVLSFNRDLKRESERLEMIAFKVEGSLAKSDTGLRKIDNIEKRIQPFETQINNLEEQKRNFENQRNLFETKKSLIENQIIQVNSIAQSNSSLSLALSDLACKIKDIESTQENLKIKIISYEEQIQKIVSSPPEYRVEQAMHMPVIPIKRDKALASLTNTEVAVLEMLSNEGPKTAPEIKDRVQLSREHTARLMKKLYEEGYVEREIGKIPFRYSVKSEMEKLLKKAEPSTPQT
jgi:DNA-binding MarR family transcriptional regulator/septal ring factor EnvC (AmiA/AmiB activator)